MTYEQLVQAAGDDNIEVMEVSFRGGLKGLYADNVISINSKIQTDTEKKCILIEELGHHYTTTGNILDVKNVSNRKQELKARNWSYEKLVPFKSLINASKEGIVNFYELAYYLDVTEYFLKEALQYYQNKYGLYAEEDNYCIYFSPLTVCKYNYEE